MQSARVGFPSATPKHVASLTLRASRRRLTANVISGSLSPYVCRRCQQQRPFQLQSIAFPKLSFSPRRHLKRSWSSSTQRWQSDATTSSRLADGDKLGAGTASGGEAPVSKAAGDVLPSQRDRQRWHLSKRLSRAMDDAQTKLVIAGQKLNNYTGTDYSGIQALREEIREQGESLILLA